MNELEEEIRAVREDITRERTAEFPNQRNLRDLRASLATLVKARSEVAHLEAVLEEMRQRREGARVVGNA